MTQPAVKREKLFFGDRALSLTLIGLVVLLTVLPLLYMISLALQSDQQSFSGQPVIWPGTLRWGNFDKLFHVAPFGRFLINSAVVALGITASHLIFDPLAGYVFAKFDFPFKRTIFILLLSTLIIPFFVRMLPIYVLYSHIGFLNTYQGLITPFLMDTYGIFLMRQFIEPLPDELIEAARVDGASELGIYLRVILPQTKPALATLGLLTFVFQWNEFLWPLIATSSESMRTLPIGLTLFNQESFTEWNLTAAGSLVLFTPTILLSLFAQRYIVRGVSLSGLK